MKMRAVNGSAEERTSGRTASTHSRRRHSLLHLVLRGIECAGEANTTPTVYLRLISAQPIYPASYMLQQHSASNLSTVTFWGLERRKWHNAERHVVCEACRRCQSLPSVVSISFAAAQQQTGGGGEWVRANSKVGIGEPCPSRSVQAQDESEIN